MLQWSVPIMLCSRLPLLRQCRRDDLYSQGKSRAAPKLCIHVQASVEVLYYVKLRGDFIRVSDLMRSISLLLRAMVCTIEEVAIGVIGDDTYICDVLCFDKRSARVNFLFLVRIKQAAQLLKSIGEF
ncbi:uncharacterized protein PHALS_12560 [Plasmopara halstedii]|uniref:Uncharacterized protein n=1 Tax=Plasmopara halstedii TaxID=4781 RepID=A0A0P1AMT8_PLAHL|nr:uncharacterized protein PHALS_12560 [Plasmopara halstedii]CEG42270.1 hypothetical protein PHALS_12560 [Plasmopara halstedii]|eukprot:XP_024578639.1 hypothetical protein PHALS_12560 [Plasmopara halstedii]